MLLAGKSYAQAPVNGLTIKQEIIQAFGGKKAIQRVKTFSYTLEKGAPQQTKITEKITMDFKAKYLKKTFEKEGVSITQVYKNGQGWEIKKGKQTKLSDAQSQRLANNFFYNFIGMLQNAKVQWKYIKNIIYREQKVRVVRVVDGQNKLDLFVNAKGDIVTSSTPDAAGNYSYYADELKYKKVGKGVRFPLIFKVFRGGKCTYEGRFKGVVIS